MFKKLKKTKSEIESERLRLKHEKSKPKKKKTTSKLSAENLRGKPYSLFLRSKYWSAVRKKVLERDGKKCVICGYDKWLEIHHNSYKNHFNEHKHLGDLMTLCRKCHKEHHYAQS